MASNFDKGIDISFFVFVMCWVVSVLWGELLIISGEPSVSVSICV